MEIKNGIKFYSFNFTILHFNLSSPMSKALSPSLLFLLVLLAMTGSIRAVIQNYISQNNVMVLFRNIKLTHTTHNYPLDVRKKLLPILQQGQGLVKVSQGSL
jgi:hypothetical protein